MWQHTLPLAVVFFFQICVWDIYNILKITIIKLKLIIHVYLTLICLGNYQWSLEIGHWIFGHKELTARFVLDKFLSTISDHTDDSCRTHTSAYGGPQLSWQKPKTARQKQNSSQQNQKPHDKNNLPHDKTKNLTAKPNTSQQKPNTSQQKQIPMANLKLFCYFVLAMRFLVLPWQLWATISATHQSQNKKEVFEDNKICSVGSKTAAHWKLALVVCLLWKINLSQKGIFLSLTDKWNRG